MNLMNNTKNQLIMEKVLFDERKDLAMQAIYDARRNGQIMTDLIAYYNSMPVLAPISKAEEVKEFFKNPVVFFEARVLRDSGIKFPDGAKPRAAVIASMYEIPHSAFCDKITHTRYKSFNLKYYVFDEATRRVELLPTAEDTIREEWKLYIEPGAEQEEYNKIQKIADAINELAPRYKIDGTELHRVNQALRFLKTAPMGEGERGWKLVPDFSEIKKHLGKPANEL